MTTPDTGSALALLRSRIESDREVILLVEQVIDPAALLDGALVLAQYICDGAAPIGYEDGAAWVARDAATSKGLVPDRVDIAVTTGIYESRDAFLGALAFGERSESGLPSVCLPDEWVSDPFDVILGIQLALERLFYYDLTGALPEDHDEDDLRRVTEELLDGYRSYVLDLTS